MNNQSGVIMNSKEILPAGTSRRFTFKMLPWLCLWLVVVEVLFISIGIMSIGKRGMWGGITVSIIGCSILGFMGWFTIRGYSDIVINDQTISRVVYGKIWQQFRWDEIERVVIRRTIDPNSNRGKTIRGFALYKRKLPGRLMAPWAILLGEEGKHAAELIALLNLYIAKHGIKIVSLIDGEKVVDHL